MGTVCPRSHKGLKAGGWIKLWVKVSGTENEKAASFNCILCSYWRARDEPRLGSISKQGLNQSRWSTTFTLHLAVEWTTKMDLVWPFRVGNSQLLHICCCVLRLMLGIVDLAHNREVCNTCFDRDLSSNRREERKFTAEQLSMLIALYFMG